jgi:hypothetical protein
MVLRVCILGIIAFVCFISINETFAARLPEHKALRRPESGSHTLTKKHGGKGTECDKRRFRKSMLKLIREVRRQHRPVTWGNHMYAAPVLLLSLPLSNAAALGLI